MPQQNKLDLVLKNIDSFASMLNQVGFSNYLNRNEVRSGITAAVSAFRQKKAENKEVRKVTKAWVKQSWQLKALLVAKPSSVSPQLDAEEKRENVL